MRNNLKLDKIKNLSSEVLCDIAQFLANSMKGAENSFHRELVELLNRQENVYKPLGLPLDEKSKKEMVHAVYGCLKDNGGLLDNLRNYIHRCYTIDLYNL